MSNFLSNLVKNNLDPDSASLVQPRLPSLFEPAAFSEEPLLLPEQKTGPWGEIERERPVAATNQQPVTPPIPLTDPAPGQPLHYQTDPPGEEISVSWTTPAPKPSQGPPGEQPAHLTKQANPVLETDRKSKPVASPSLIKPGGTPTALPPNNNRPVLPVTEIRPAPPNNLLHQPLSPTPSNRSPVEPAPIEIKPASAEPGALPVSSHRRQLNEAPLVAAGQPAWPHAPWKTAPDSPPSPTINVRIGRIEVKAALPAQARPVKSPPASPVMSLEQYLRRRNGGGDR